MAVANVKQELKTVSSVKAKAEKGEGARLQNQAEVGQELAVLLSDVFASAQKLHSTDLTKLCPIPTHHNPTTWGLCLKLRKPP